MTTAIQTQKPSEKAVEYIPHGASDKIKLTVAIIQNLIAVKTKSGKTCDERQAMKFIMLCQAQHLNPFAGDAYLLGYDTQDGPQFSLITAHQAFLKRAEVSKDFDGMQSGVILRHKESGDITEIEGDFYDQEFYELVGGWARVHHKMRKFPAYQRLKLARFNKGYGVWKDDPAGMICKVAESQALRATFPTLLGGLYVEGEVMGGGATIDITPVASTSKLVEMAPSEPTPEPEENKNHGVTMSDAKPQGGQQQQSEEPTFQDTLMEIVVKAGFSFDLLKSWAVQGGHFTGKQVDDINSFEEIPDAIAKRFVSARTGLLKGLAALKGGAQ